MAGEIIPAQPARTAASRETLTEMITDTVMTTTLTGIGTGTAVAVTEVDVEEDTAISTVETGIAMAEIGMEETETSTMDRETDMVKAAAEVAATISDLVEMIGTGIMDPNKIKVAALSSILIWVHLPRATIMIDAPDPGHQADPTRILSPAGTSAMRTLLEISITSRTRNTGDKKERQLPRQ